MTIQQITHKNGQTSSYYGIRVSDFRHCGDKVWWDFSLRNPETGLLDTWACCSDYWELKEFNPLTPIGTITVTK